MKTVLYTGLALLAFAGNSVLCRLALGQGLMDVAGFTSVRLLAGAITLVLLLLFLQNKPPNTDSLFKPTRRSWFGALLLFAYALFFSYAYVLLETGSGALILFGAVQLTILLTSFFKGQRPGALEWLGVLLAFTGLIYLMIPAWGTPTLLGFVLMSLSGMAWGFYTIAGQGSVSALADTTKNFLYALPLVLVLCLVVFQPHLWTTKGVWLAVISGAVTSGLGYAIWYAVLPELRSTQAGVVQLLVPIIAAIGGVWLVGEAMTSRLIIASLLVLGGVYMVMVATQPSRQK